MYGDTSIICAPLDSEYLLGRMQCFVLKNLRSQKQLRLYVLSNLAYLCNIPLVVTLCLSYSRIQNEFDSYCNVC